MISRNLSFTKTTGEIEMNKKTKQKFYQIPFGRLLNLLESKLKNLGNNNHINTIEIDEAYTSKTSALTADVVQVQHKAKNKLNNKSSINLLPNDFNGTWGTKKKGNVNNPLGRGLFKDHILNKVVHADLNAAANHVKVGCQKIGLNNIVINTHLAKYCNPKKIKSNHEFDRFLKTCQIVDTQKSL